MSRWGLDSYLQCLVKGVPVTVEAQSGHVLIRKEIRQRKLCYVILLSYVRPHSESVHGLI